MIESKQRIFEIVSKKSRQLVKVYFFDHLSSFLSPQSPIFQKSETDTERNKKKKITMDHLQPWQHGNSISSPKNLEQNLNFFFTLLERSRSNVSEPFTINSEASIALMSFRVWVFRWPGSIPEGSLQRRRCSSDAPSSSVLAGFEQFPQRRGFVTGFHRIGYSN